MPPAPPRVDVALAAIRRRGAATWLVTWRIRQRGASALTITEAWHPHGRFHSSRLRRSLRVPPRATATLELPARVDASPGHAVENCFLILRAARGRERWRILVRFTLRIERDVPRLTIERVDADRVDG